MSLGSIFSAFQGPQIDLGEVTSAWDLPEWQQAPVDSILEKYPGDLQRVLDNAVMDLGGGPPIFRMVQPEDFGFLIGPYGAQAGNRAEILADAFNSAADIIMEMLEESWLEQMQDDMDADVDGDEFGTGGLWETIFGFF